MTIETRNLKKTPGTATCLHEKSKDGWERCFKIRTAALRTLLFFLLCLIIVPYYLSIQLLENDQKEVDLMNEEKSEIIEKNLDHNSIRAKLDNAMEELVKAYILKNFADEILPLNEFTDRVEAEIIRYALMISEENQKKTAFLLGLNAPTLCEKMKRYNIKIDRSMRKSAMAFVRSLDEIGKLVTDN